ncbi:EAL domain-containing protein [Nitrosomonas sp. ANs5]|uniref:bifunctional diguanylate cyclase/phosphodiesterase n=1 Tax=Nitrosomonas sp. ANs5 TaxID=3423941 RepID=UPI003D33B7D2
MKQVISENSIVSTKTSPQSSRAFVGLSWKISTLSSLILLLVVTTFSVINYQSLLDSIEQQRETQYQRYAREVESLIGRSAENLHELIRIIPYLKGMENSLLAANPEQILASFDRYWTLFQIQNDIEDVRFYDASESLLASWSNFEANGYRDNLILEHVREVNSREQPATPMICVESCTQYTIEPLLINGTRVGVIAIGSSLIDVFLNFRRASGSDIGLFIKQKENAYDTPSDTNMRIPEWNVRITALTDSKRNLAILNKVAKKHPDFENIGQGIQNKWNDRHHQIRLLPLHGIRASDQAQLVIVTEVTDTVRAIQDSIWRIVIIGLIGLVLSEIILFSVLSRPLSRLKHLVSILPLLAGGGFGGFRSALASHQRKRLLEDEIDLLYEASLTLSQRLEKLEKQVAYRTKMLINQRDELSKEKDFIENLLDTAQVIVLTQDADGKIVMLNAYGEMLTRYSEQELQGRYFLELLAPDSEHYNLDGHMLEIRQGLREQLRHEAVVLCKDDSKRHIAWLHSRLTWHAGEDPSMVLSVGLDITEYKRVEGHLAWLADHDPLTNLYNRRRFSEELEQILSWAERYQHPGALLFFDLDRFKYINDTSGHQAGDALLKMVSDMLSRTIRTADISGRLGGDEFAVILPEITPEAAIEVAKKILNRLSETQLALNGRTHNIAASIGIALFPEHGNNVHDLLAAADLAMYQAKETGRGTWHLFSNTDQTRERVHTLVYWKEKIEYANLHDRYQLHLQPILSLHDKTINHYEVLLRMQDEDGTIHSPAAFIPAAEHTGLIHKIDHMVLRKAVALAGRINQKANRPIGLSINLSAHAFNDPELLPVISQTISACGIDPTLLMFEITETAALDNLPGTRSLLRDLKKLGCGFVLDDFGVGFSSFYYLRELPVDAVKIDGSFIRNLASNPDDRILVSALCSVAKGFGKKITAEFVENQAILDMLESMDIDFAQGYHIGKPAPADNFFPISKN